MRQLEGGGEERGGCRKKAEGVVWKVSTSNSEIY